MDSGKKLQWEIIKEFNIYLCSNVKILVSVKYQVLKKPFYAEVIIGEFNLHIYFFSSLSQYTATFSPAVCRKLSELMLL